MPDAELIPAESVEEAAWLRDGIIGFAESVVSIVPAGFAAYARILHPAMLDEDTPVSWREVARATDRTVHRAMQWPSLVGTVDSNHTLEGVWDAPPRMGSLPRVVVPNLVAVLRRHTHTPEACWFAVWDGFGPAMRSLVTSAPTFSLPHRRYHLLEGAIESINDSAQDPPFCQSANLWWPADRAWCIASEIDFVSTYVGGSRACIDELVDADGLEVFEVEPADGVTWLSESVNPLPLDLPPGSQ